jgi:hypothetical protein
MGKYSPLKSFLIERHTEEIPMTFKEIEVLIGGELPPVAFKHRAWWSNNPSNNVMTRAWLEAGYKTEKVDMADEKLVFVRADGDRPPSPISPQAIPVKGFLARVQERLAGTVTVSPDIDIMAPLDEKWDAEQ